MSLNFVLVPGPLVRASSFEPTAKELRKSGHHVQTPDVLDGQLASDGNRLIGQTRRASLVNAAPLDLDSTF
jgi:hypothetical protein